MWRGHSKYVRAAWVSLLVVVGACSDPSATSVGEGRGEDLGSPVRSGDVPSLQIGVANPPRPWDAGPDALRAAVEGADGYAVVAFKAPASRRAFDAGGFRTAVPAKVVEQGVALLRARGVEVSGVLRSIGAARVRFADAEVAAELRSHALVDFIEPRQRLHIDPDDTQPGPANTPASGRPGIFRSTMAEVVPWGVTMVRAPEAWPVTTGANVKVMLLVPGGPGSHADLPPFDPNHCGGGWWHACDGWEGTGTLMVSQIASPPDESGIVGVAHGATPANMYAWNPCFQDSQDPQALNCYDDQMAAAVDAAVLVGARVFTFGKFAWRAADSQTLSAAIARAWTADVVLLAAVGPFTTPYVDDAYPAIYPNVLGVSGVRDNRAFASTSICTNADGSPFGSSYGPQVDIAAPFWGWGAWPINAYVERCGPSSMTDYATGVVILIRSANPTWTNQQVVERLQSMAIDCGAPGRDDQFGYGIVDAAAALGVAARQSCVPFQVTATAPGLVKIKRIYPLTGSANSPASSWRWERSLDGGPWEWWSNSQNASFIAYGGNYTIDWRLTVTRASDGATATSVASTRVCIPYSSSTCPML